MDDQGRVTGALLATLLAGSVVLDLLFFTGFIASDDILYTTAARKLAETGMLWPDPGAHEARLLMIGWCAFAGFWVEHDVQAVAASFIFFHQALNVLTFALGRHVLGPRVGLLAAAFSAAFPLLVVFSTTILPDIPMTVCFVAALLALRSADAWRPGGRRDGLLLALSGAMVGLAYLAKESGLIPLPYFLVLALVHGRRAVEGGRHLSGALARGAALLAGLGLVLGLEAVTLRLLTGSWLFRLGSLLKAGSGAVPPLAAIGERAVQLAAMAAAHAGASAAAVLIVLATAIYAGKRLGLRSILFFPAWYVAYYMWGSARFTSYYSPSLQIRYFIPCIPFLLIPVAALLCEGWSLASERARRLHPRPEGLLRALGATVLTATLAAALAVSDREAGNLYGAPLASQSVRALRSWESSGRGPIVISETLGAQLFPLLRKRPDGLLFSHEVGASQVERWRHTGGFQFMDLHPNSPLRRPELNPLLGWRHGLPASERHVETLVESLLSGGAGDHGWIMRPAGRFDRVGPRSAELRMLFGDPGALPHLRHRPDRGVLVYELATMDHDVRYPRPAIAPGQAPAALNGSFEQWSEAGPVGWHTRDTVASRVQGPEGNAAVRIGPGALSYLWQSLPAPATVRGRDLVLRARTRSDAKDAARLWIRIAVRAEWEEVFGDPHPGDGAWRWLEATLPVPPQFAGGEARIVLLHAGTRGHSEFDDVALSVR
jgi:hypothetical protein